MKNTLSSPRFQRLAKEAVWVFFGQALMVVGSLVGVRLLTEALPPSGYGELALGMTIATLVNQIILGPLGGGILRFYAVAVKFSDVSGYLDAVIKISLYATGIVILIATIVISILLVMGKSYLLPITVSAFIFAILSGYVSNISGIQTASRQRSIVALHQGLEPLLRSLVAVCLLFSFGIDSYLAMIGYAFASLIILLSQLLFSKIRVSAISVSKFSQKWFGDIWRFSWPIGIFGIFTCLQVSSDRWALNFFASNSEVGNYAVLYQLGYYPITLLTGMMLQFLLPILYQHTGDASNLKKNADVTRLSWQLTWFSLGLTLFTFLGALFFHSQLFHILVAKEYRSVSYLVPWIIISGGVFASGQTLASNLQAKMKTREMMMAKIVTALFGILLNFVGAYFYGIKGVVCAGILFSILYFFWMASLVNKWSN